MTSGGRQRRTSLRSQRVPPQETDENRASDDAMEVNIPARPSSKRDQVRRGTSKPTPNLPISIDSMLQNPTQGTFLRRSERLIARERSRQPSLVRKPLLGKTPNPKQTDAYLQSELDKLQRDHTERWNFDFANDKPLEGNYSWQPLAPEKNRSS